MSYVIMEIVREGDVRYRIGIENDYKLSDGKIELIGEPQIYYREVCQRSIGLEDFETDDSGVLNDIETFKKVLNDLINDSKFNREVYNHFFIDLADDYPEDVFKDIYYEFN